MRKLAASTIAAVAVLASACGSSSDDEPDFDRGREAVEAGLSFADLIDDGDVIIVCDVLTGASDLVSDDPELFEERFVEWLDQPSVKATGATRADVEAWIDAVC